MVGVPTVLRRLAARLGVSAADLALAVVLIRIIQGRRPV